MDVCKTASFLAGALSVYSRLKTDPVVGAMAGLSGALDSGPDDFARGYSALLCALSEAAPDMGLSEYLFERALYDENSFTRAAAHGGLVNVAPPLLAAATHDLNTLGLLAKTTAEQLKELAAEKYPDYATLLRGLPGYRNGDIRRWAHAVPIVGDFCSKNGCGSFARYAAFEVSIHNAQCVLTPVAKADPIRLSDLKDYEYQRGIIEENTLAFLGGHRANNILLYGDRGTGKSSTVKALLNEYQDRGLRLIELTKEKLTLFPRVLEKIEGIPLRFIIFIDDLSFSDTDDNFGALKALLEGSVVSKPDNVIVYATSNRRHLIKETFSSREGDEIHRGDTIDETMSLSDRFGITVTFMVPNKEKYLRIVGQIAEDRGMTTDPELLRRKAESWAIQKGGRSPRVARQFIDYAEAREKQGLAL